MLILHTIRHRGHGKTLLDICHVLDTEDLHVVNYALRKLEAAGLVVMKRVGKEKTARITPKGVAACNRYAEIREHLLVRGMSAARPAEVSLSEVASILRHFSGAYDQAVRSAATLANEPAGNDAAE